MISKKEFQARLDKVVAEVTKRKLKALIIIDSEHRSGGGNVRYLSNFFSPQNLGVNTMVISPEGTTLIVNPGFKGMSVVVAKKVSWIEDIVGTRRRFWGYHDVAQDIKDVLNKYKITRGRIGADGIALATEPVSNSIRAALSSFQLVENTGIVEKVRMVKSPAELKLAREASRLADVGMTALLKGVKPGKSLNVSVSEGIHAATIEGLESGFPYWSSGKPINWRKTERGSVVYKKGNIFASEFNSCFEGYFGQVCRSIVLGKASAKQEYAYEVALEAYRTALSMIKPGVTGVEIAAAANKVVARDGNKPADMKLGHGMGLSMGEGFEFYESNEPDHLVEMVPGFYGALHVNGPIDEKLVLGNAFVVTKTGCEEVNKIEFRFEVD